MLLSIDQFQLWFGEYSKLLCKNAKDKGISYLDDQNSMVPNILQVRTVSREKQFTDFWSHLKCEFCIFGT